MYTTVFTKCHNSLGEHALALFATINVLGVLAVGLAQGVWAALGLGVASVLVWGMPAPVSRRGAAACAAHSSETAGDAWLDAFARGAKIVAFALLSVVGAGLIWLVLKADIGSGWIAFPGYALGLIMTVGGLKLLVEEVFGVRLAFTSHEFESDDSHKKNDLYSEYYPFSICNMYHNDLDDFYDGR